MDDQIGVTECERGHRIAERVAKAGCPVGSDGRCPYCRVLLATTWVEKKDDIRGHRDDCPWPPLAQHFG
jgi:hypothetical protein